METVEKHLNPLICLPFGLRINCGTPLGSSTCLWNDGPLSIYSLFSRRIPASLLCIPCINFDRDKVFWGDLLRGRNEYPQIHRMWIKMAVDGKHAPKKRECCPLEEKRGVVHRLSPGPGRQKTACIGLYMRKMGFHPAPDGDEKAALGRGRQRKRMRDPGQGTSPSKGYGYFSRSFRNMPV